MVAVISLNCDYSDTFGTSFTKEIIENEVEFAL